MRFNVFFTRNGAKAHEVVEMTYHDPIKIENRIKRKYKLDEVKIDRISKVNSGKEGRL